MPRQPDTQAALSPGRPLFSPLTDADWERQLRAARASKNSIVTQLREAEKKLGLSRVHTS